MLKFRTKLAPVLNRRGAVVGLTTAVVLAPSFASAQTSGAADMNFAAWVGAVQDTAIAIINTSGPALFGLLAIIGGLYFVWNRVRSLW